MAKEVKTPDTYDYYVQSNGWVFGQFRKAGTVLNLSPRVAKYEANLALTPPSKTPAPKDEKPAKGNDKK